MRGGALIKKGVCLRVALGAVFCAALCATALLAACVHTSGTAESVPPARVAAGSPAAIPPAENLLDSPAFKTLPPEALSYLERLARAFSSQDEAFLLAQGESQFEAENRSRYDAASYLALLYRTGAYAAESPRLDGPPPRLETAGVSHIQYLSWVANGPLLEIPARLVGKDGAVTPCRIMLVWRLREPKIEGLFL
jgi:hypothetical protein